MADHESFDILKIASKSATINCADVMSTLKCDQDHADFVLQFLSSETNGLLESIRRFSDTVFDEYGNSFIEDSGDYRITPKGKSYLNNKAIERREMKSQTRKSNIALVVSASALLISLFSNLDKIQANLKLLTDWLSALLSTH